MNRLIVVGAGPIGLHAALQAKMNGFHVTVLERGNVGAAIQRWAHVKLFTPFSMNSTASGRTAAAETAPLPHGDELLTGDAYVQHYLSPLAASEQLRGVIQTSTELIAVSRSMYGKKDAVRKPERSTSPFRLLVRRGDGSETVMESEILFDCTGFTTQHRAVGIGGIPCPGELRCLTHADYEIAAPQSLPGSSDHTLVIGSGYSAATSVCVLQNSVLNMTWITRGSRDVPIAPVADDRLPERRALTDQANALALRPGSPVQWCPGVQVESIERNNGKYQLNISSADGHQKTLTCDRVVANPGFRPDNRPFEELQIHRCYATEGPIKLAAHLIGETSDDCLNQTGGTVELLSNPEPHFYILGAASYGRDPRFLMKNGFDQIEQLFDQYLCPKETPV
ncbi:MAG: NAD(P)-binding domain-containing protein [Fuerstiella sp.]|nr:NAD(P)-binding domain-containing protein [Fuerstiella sp.]